MTINTDSIDALKDAAQEFARSCQSEVKEYELSLRWIQSSGEEIVNSAQNVCNEFPPLIEDLKEKKYGHEKMLEGLDDLIEKTRQEIDDRKAEADLCRAEAEQCRAEERTYLDLASEARREANSCKEGEDPSGFIDVSNAYEQKASMMADRAKELENRVWELGKQIDGFEVQLKEFEDHRQKTKVTIDDLTSAISDAETRFNEAEYRLGQLKSSVHDAVAAARNALEDARNNSQDAERCAQRIVERAEEANRIIADYYR